MVESESSPDNCKTLKISIRAMIITNPKMLKFVPDHLETKKMCKTCSEKVTICNNACS